MSAQIAGEDPNKIRDVSFRELVGPLPADDLSHSIYPYPARLLRHIPRLLLHADQVVSPSSLVIDPFCGSGTVVLEAMAAGNQAVGVDANPMAALISTVKTTRVEQATVLSSAASAIAQARSYRKAELPADYLARWYEPDAQVQLAKLSRAIRAAPDSDVKNAIQLTLALTARDASLTDKRIPVPVRPRTEHVSSRSVWSLFEANARRVAERVSRIPAGWPQPLCILGDAREPDVWAQLPKAEDAVVMTSPPYGAAQKYVRSTSLELGWLGAAGRTGTIELERSSIGREHLAAGERANPLDQIESEALRQRLDRLRPSSPQRADIYATYFLDMQRAFTTLVSNIPAMRRFVLIAGTNVVAGTELPTHMYLEEMLSFRGFRVVTILRDEIRGRSLLTSRKNSVAPARAEYVYILEKQEEPDVVHH